MTNYDWLKTLSVEDLAEIIRHKCRLCIFYNDDCSCGGELDCIEGISAWLREEHKEKHKEKLKPCPFCGGKPIVDKNQNSVYCADCHMGTPWTDSIEDAINTWNRRVDNAD